MSACRRSTPPRRRRCEVDRSRHAPRIGRDRRGLATCLLLVALAPATAAKAPAAKPYQLAPYKDELFQYANVLDTQYEGDFLLVEYNRPRDLYARDVERGTKVDPKYVSLDTQAVESERTLDVGGHTIAYSNVGKVAGAKAIVIFLHGLGIGRAAGVNDWIHGGNFNRIKNLMMRNDGVYISASFSDFAKKGAAEIKALVLERGAPFACRAGVPGLRFRRRQHLLAPHPRSRGQAVARRPGLARLRGGHRLPEARRDSSAGGAGADHISSSKEDTLLGWKSQLKFFRDMKTAVPAYPIRFVLFTQGTHGISLEDDGLAGNAQLDARGSPGATRTISGDRV